MRTQTSTLTAAARARQRQPRVLAIIQDWQRRWSQTWKDASLTTTHHTAACAGVLDPTKLIRVRNNAGAIECQVIANPATAAQWATWSITVSTGHAAHASSHVAIGQGEGNTLHCYYWKAGASPNSIRCVISSDDGATWSGNHEVKGTAPSGYVIATSGRADCWWIGGSPVRVTMRTRSGGVWSADNTNGALSDISAATGLAAASDSNNSKVVYCAAYRTTAAANPYVVKLSSQSYAGAYSSTYFTLPPTMAGISQNRPQCPSLAISGDGYPYLSLAELWSDGTNNYYDVTLWKCLGTAADGYQYWGDIALLNLPLANVCQVPLVEHLWSSRYVLYVAGEYNVRQSTALNLNDTDRYLEDANVIAFHLQEDDTIRRGWLDLDNTGNKYRQRGVNGQLGAPIKPLSRLYLQLGYRTTAGDETIELYPYWIESSELLFGPGQQPRLRLNLIGGWRVAEQWHAPYAMTFTAQTAKSIFKTLLALTVGVYATDDSSAAWNQTIGTFSISAGRRQQRAWAWRSEYVSPDGVPLPAYTVTEGTSGLEALWRLLVITGGKLLWCLHGQGYLCDLKAQNPTVADYEVGANAEIEDAAYTEAASGANRARVLANTGAIAEAYSDPATAETLGRMVETLETRNEIAAQALAEETAKGLTDEGKREGVAGWIKIPLVPGLELYDRLAVTDARAALSGAMRRVAALNWRYDSRRSVFHQTITLGGL
jgi:hypothetical protein